MSKRKDDAQASLFDGEAGARALGHEVKFQAGEIVLDALGIHGHYQVLHPYWQVESWAIHHDEVEYLCAAVPRGACPKQHWWFRAGDICSVGERVFPVPSAEDQPDRFRRSINDTVTAEPGSWAFEYLAALPKQSLMGDNDPAPMNRPWPVHPPYEWERELVEFLDSLPVKWYAVCRENWAATMRGAGWLS